MGGSISVEINTKLRRVDIKPHGGAGVWSCSPLTLSGFPLDGVVAVDVVPRASLELGLRLCGTGLPGVIR